jgi:hypothetical protein
MGGSLCGQLGVGSGIEAAFGRASASVTVHPGFSAAADRLDWPRATLAVISTKMKQ